jgi:hypothetical protein
MRKKSIEQTTLKPQDLAMAFKLVILRGSSFIYKDLAEQMALSATETHASVQRLLAARLAIIDPESNVVRINTDALIRLLPGTIYFFPPQRGEVTIGFVTAYGASPLREQVMFADQFPPVWPHPEGDTRGPLLAALYANLPLAAKKDAELYQMLALFDAMRIGQARECAMAHDLLQKMIFRLSQ